VRVTRSERDGEAVARLRIDADDNGRFGDAADAQVTLDWLADAAVTVTQTPTGGTEIAITGSDMVFDELSVPDRIATLHLGILDRAPDPAVLAEQVASYEAARAAGMAPRRALHEVAETLGARAEDGRLPGWEALEPGTAAPPARAEAFISDLYTRYFGREPSDGGLAYWREALLHRVAEGRDLAATVIDIAAGALDAAAVSDPGSAGEQVVHDATTLRQRIELAQQTARQLGAEGVEPTEAELRLPFADVDASYASFVDTLAEIDVVGAPGSGGASHGDDVA
jgi:hypothetical protein